MKRQAKTTRIHEQFFCTEKPRLESLSDEKRRIVSGFYKFWERGLKAGWDWLETAHAEDAEEVSYFDSYNEGLAEEREKLNFCTLYPGLYPETDTYFENAARDVDEFEAYIRDDLDDRYNDAIAMNGPFRAFYDGWLASVQEDSYLRMRGAEFPGPDKQWDYIRGGVEGWEWAESQSIKEVWSVARRVTLNQVLALTPSLPYEEYHHYDPYFLPTTDDFFRRLLGTEHEYAHIEINPYIDSIMNERYRIYHDGWQAGVREYYMLIYLEEFELTPEYWGDG